MSANDRQVGGEHYKSEYQHWDFCAHAFGDAHFKSAITKYVSRWRQKGGLLDLEKATHYLEKMIELSRVEQTYDGIVTNNPMSLNRPLDPLAASLFVITNSLPKLESLVILNVAGAYHEDHLRKAQKLLSQLHQEAYAEEMRKNGPRVPPDCLPDAKK